MLRSLEGALGGRGGIARVSRGNAWIGWTYRYSCQQRFDKAIILSQEGKHLGIIGDVDEDRKGIFRYRLEHSNQSVLAWSFERVCSQQGAAYSIVLDQQLQILHRCKLGVFENGWMGLRVRE